MPWVSAFIGGYGVYLLDCAFLRRSRSWPRIAVGGLLGFSLGAYSSFHVGNTIPRVVSEADIINAFDRKYMTTVLNTTGFGSNYISVKDYSETNTFKKPY
jgi:hypothetical protein